MPKFPQSGGCACRSIRYEITALPSVVYACHCTDCQRKTGSAFAMNMSVKMVDFRITEGEPKGWRTVNPASGIATVSWACAECSTRIYGEREDRPEMRTIRSGSLDDTSWLRPAAHFFMCEAQPWEAINDGAPQFERLAGADEIRAASAAWQAKMSGDD
jgi:hypothetical protein